MQKAGTKMWWHWHSSLERPQEHQRPKYLIHFTKAGTHVRGWQKIWWLHNTYEVKKVEWNYLKLWSMRMGNLWISQNFKNKMKYQFQLPCSGMRSTTLAAPVNVAIPICCHIKYTIITICTGPIQMYARKRSNTSNRLTSFDRRFTAWPTTVSPRAVLLNFNAWNYNAKTEHKKHFLLSLDKAKWCSMDRLK